MRTVVNHVDLEQKIKFRFSNFFFRVSYSVLASRFSLENLIHFTQSYKKLQTLKVGRKVEFFSVKFFVANFTDVYKKIHKFNKYWNFVTLET